MLLSKPMESKANQAPLRGWRSWAIAAFMWIACRFVPPGYAIDFDLVKTSERVKL